MPKGRVPYPFGKCTVCSDQATGNHYGAVTCEGCKGFFKRSLGKSHTYRCRGSYNCSVGTDNRIKCKACRFKRCKELGMSMSAIKMGRIPKAEKLRALESAYGDLATAVAAVAVASGGSSLAASAAAASAGSAAASSSCSPTTPARGTAEGSGGGGDSPGVAFERRHVGAAGAAAETSPESFDSPTAAGGGADACTAYAAAADPAVQPVSAGGVSFGSIDDDFADDLDAALDLSSKAADQPPLGTTVGKAAAGGGRLTGAMRQLTVVNSLIAKHVRAMDGAAYGGRVAAREHAVTHDLCRTGVASATGPPPHDDVEFADTRMTAAQPAGGGHQLLPAAIAAVHLGAAAEEQTLTVRAGGGGGSSGGSSGSSNGGGSCVQVPTGHSKSGNGIGPDGSDSIIDSHDDFTVPSCVTEVPSGGGGELLSSKTLSETVQAVSCAYLKMCAATRRCIDVMSRRIATGQDGADHPSIPDDSQLYALEQVMIGFDLLGNKLMGFIKSCPGLRTLWTEDVLVLAKRVYLSIWLVLESPLFRDGESHMLLPNGRRHARSWMRLYLPEVLVERMHAYARAQVAARLTVPELGLMCGLLLTSRCRNQSLSDEAAVIRLNSIFTQALSYEVHRGRLHPHRILASIWHLLAMLQDVNDSHEALARCGSSNGSAGAAAQPQPSGYSVAAER